MKTRIAVFIILCFLMISCHQLWRGADDAFKHFHKAKVKVVKNNNEEVIHVEHLKDYLLDPGHVSDIPNAIDVYKQLVKDSVLIIERSETNNPYEVKDLAIRWKEFHRQRRESDSFFRIKLESNPNYTPASIRGKILNEGTTKKNK